jgi:hypothetical protein
VGLFLRRSKPEPLAQPVGFVSLPLPGLGLGLWLKGAAIAAVLVAGAYQAGIWIGDGRGYDRKSIEVAKAVADANRQIDELHSALDAERAKDEGDRDVAAAAAIKSLTDIPAEVRQQCAKSCSMPEQARAELEKIK